MANNPISQSPDSPIAAFEKRLPAEIGTGAFSRSDFNNGFGVGSVMGSFPKKDLYLPACRFSALERALEAILTTAAELEQRGVLSHLH
jgi:hypothetical protein